MTSTKTQLDRLLDMFHDFEIVGLDIQNEVMTMTVNLPWAEMWDKDEYNLTFKFSGCKDLTCHYFKRTSNELIHWDKGAYYPSEEIVTSKPDEILKLELDVQSHDHLLDDSYSLHCNSSTSFNNEIGSIEFARIDVRLNNYQIFDDTGNELSIETMESWANQWWEEIK